MTNEVIDDECWIMQNSWGRGAGWDGFYFVHTDLECDVGIISSGGAVIPLFEKEETEAETSSGRGSPVLCLCSSKPVAIGNVCLGLNGSLAVCECVVLRVERRRLK